MTSKNTKNKRIYLAVLSCMLFFLLPIFSKAQPSAYKEAIQLAQEGSAQEGLRILQEALQTDSQNSQLLYYTGWFLEQLKSTSKAVALYKEALQIDEANFEASYRLGFLYEKADSLDIALSYYEKALAHTKTETKEERNTILSRLIFLSDKAKKYDQSIKKFADEYFASEALENIPLPVALALANIQYQHFEYEEAQRLTHSILEKTSFNSNPYPIQKAAFIYTNAAFRLQDFEGMKKYYARIQDKKLRTEIENTAPQYYYNLGYAYFFMYEFEKSLRYLRTALVIKPDYSPAQVFLNRVEDQKSDKSNVIDHIRQKIKLSEHKSHDAAYYYDLTRLCVYEKRYQEAIKVADSCLKLEPNRKEVYFLEAIANYKITKDEEGITILRKAIANFPNLKKEEKAKHYFLMGLLYKRMKNELEAQKAFKVAKVGIFQDAAHWELSKLNEDE